MACQSGDHPEKEDHRYLNLILSHLDEQQRRWVAGREARRRGHGGIQQVAEITGLHPETIRIGRDELDRDLVGRTTTRTGLKVTPTHFEKTYQTGQRISNAEFKAIQLTRHATCPQWNYTIRPRAGPENTE